MGEAPTKRAEPETQPWPFLALTMVSLRIRFVLTGPLPDFHPGDRRSK